MAISFFIGWAIFSPFAFIEDLQQWSFARIEITDLLALFLPFSLVLALVNFTVPKDTFTVPVIALVLGAVTVLALFGLVVGLFLLAKMNRTTPAKRMTMIGVVIPLGFVLTIAWSALPLYGFGHSILHAIPATLGIPVGTLILRGLSVWVCESAEPGGVSSS